MDTIKKLFTHFVNYKFLSDVSLLASEKYYICQMQQEETD